MGKLTAMAAAGLVATAFVAMSAKAQAPAGFEPFYERPTDVNLGGRPVVADIMLSGRANLRSRRVALTVDVTKFIDETEEDLKAWIAARQNECGERWGAGEPVIAFSGETIRFAVDLTYELWTCGITGEAEPARLARERGLVDVALAAEIIDGKLQARLVDFTLSERQGVNRYLPLEFVIRRVLEAELRNLNANPKFWRAPQPFADEGYIYDDIDAQIYSDGRAVITAVYRTDDAGASFSRLAARVAKEGLTQ